MRILNNLNISTKRFLTFVLPIGVSACASMYFAAKGMKEQIESKERFTTINEIKDKAFSQQKFISQQYDSLKAEEPIFFKKEYWENAKQEILDKATIRHQEYMQKYKLRRKNLNKD